MPIGAISYGTACIAFALLSAILVAGLRRGPVGAWLLAASVAAAVWAGVTAYAQWAGGPALAMWLADDLRAAAWLAFLVALLALPWRGRLRAARDLAAPAVVVLVTAGVVVDIWVAASATPEIDRFGDRRADGVPAAA